MAEDFRKVQGFLREWNVLFTVCRRMLLEGIKSGNPSLIHRARAKETEQYLLGDSSWHRICKGCS